MANLSGIKRPDPVQYTVAMGSESVTVVFDSALMTGRWERDIERAAKAGDTETVASRLFGVFISWDVTDDNGQPVPISEEILLDLPSKALVKLFEGMREAAVPPSEEGNASSDTSPSPSIGSSPPPENPQNGQPTSSSPTVSASPSPT